MSPISHQHQAVMLKQCLEGLNIHADGCYVDATLGRGGHSLAILNKLGDKGCLLGFDKDKEAIDYVASHCCDERLVLIHSSFTQLSKILSQRNLMGKINGILMDLGVSSPQLDNAPRGFSFLLDGPLDMRMDTRTPLTAAHWLARASADEIAKVLYQFGQERKSRTIALAIKKVQKNKAITTTKQLADIIKQVAPNYQQKKHPATRTFQALRIFINHELSELEQALAQVINCLALKGRIVVISFHSLEDRIVKQFISKHSQAPKVPKYLPIIPKVQQMPLQSLGRHFASTQEIKRNVRARSAVLRIAQKILPPELSPAAI